MPNAGVVFWQPGDALAAQHLSRLEQHGWNVSRVQPNGPLPQGLDLLVAYGPLGSLVPLARQLEKIEDPLRPRFALIMTEQLPNPDLPEWLRYPLALARSHIERLAFHSNGEDYWQLRPGLRWVLKGGTRYRYYADLFWLQRAGILSVLAVWSHWTAAFLQERGFAPLVLAPDYNPALGRDMGLERDIPVLWLGKVGSKRRRALLERMRAELRARGVEMMVVDGVERPYVFGEERTRLLNRTKIVLNLLREKWDDNSLRYALAIHNRALVVTEPTLPHTAYEPGVHLVQTPVTNMADTICYYLEHEEERRQIVAQAVEMLQCGTAPDDYMCQIVEAAGVADGRLEIDRPSFERD